MSHRTREHRPGADGYRRVHRATPLLELWTVVLGIVAVIILNIDRELIDAVRSFSLGSIPWRFVVIALGSVVGFFLLVWLVSYFWWRATGYRITDEEISLKHGVIGKQERTARFDRIQAVDVVESVIARIFHVAAVRVETAGGKDSVIEIKYLSKPVAVELRAEVLARVRGEAAPVGHTTDLAEVTAPGETLPAPPERHVVVPEIPVARSLAAAALNPTVHIAAVAGLGVWVSPLSLAAAVPTLVALAGAAWRVIDRSYRFVASLHEDSLDISYGLADRRRQTIRLGRIHAVQIDQPVLWRLTGWWRVRVSVAGYGGEDDHAATTTILPVGSRDLAIRLAALVGPLSTEEIEGYARPEGATMPTFTSPDEAVWVSPIDRGQQAVTLIPGRAICHTGRLGRRVAMIERSHIQELTLHRGPLHGALGLASVRFDLVNGPVSMTGQDLRFADAQALLDALRSRELPELDAAPTQLR
ncbi:PH domain-containing protein [Corynebacterium uterequi]|uniref:Putative membrane protein n=1 Tax=Corynebacterium uterequi TaxID=1072256 RepID=A0A0G3HER7_9CORY|nr:PH domain-containing protein [Corynebacterium uterequi]AKK10468.1 putative membrane protein [Corynebacterium uterequi]